MNEQPQLPAEQQESKEFSLNQEQREHLMEYLRTNSDSAVGPEQAAATAEEDTLGQALLDLRLPRDDMTSNRMFTWSEYKYHKDIPLREEAFKNAGLTGAGLEIKQHDIVISPSSEQMNLKVINLASFDTNIPGGVIFLGKGDFSRHNAPSLNLSEDEKLKIQRFIDSRKNK